MNRLSLTRLRLTPSMPAATTPWPRRACGWPAGTGLAGLGGGFGQMRCSGAPQAWSGSGADLLGDPQ
jgi:hypothetical protein